MRIFLTTEEGYPKNNSAEGRKRVQGRKYFLQFSGNDAPIKAVRALIQKYGITYDQLGEDI